MNSHYPCFVDPHAVVSQRLKDDLVRDVFAIAIDMLSAAKGGNADADVFNIICSIADETVSGQRTLAVAGLLNTINAYAEQRIFTGQADKYKAFAKAFSSRCAHYCSIASQGNTNSVCVSPSAQTVLTLIDRAIEGVTLDTSIRAMKKKMKKVTLTDGSDTLRTLFCIAGSLFLEQSDHRTFVRWSTLLIKAAKSVINPTLSVHVQSQHVLQIAKDILTTEKPAIYAEFAQEFNKTRTAYISTLYLRGHTFSYSDQQEDIERKISDIMKFTRPLGEPVCSPT